MNDNLNQQMGLMQVWAQGDAVIKAVALLLLAMSVASWLVIILKALGLRRHAAQARAVEGFWQAADWDQGLHRLGAAEDNPFVALAQAAREGSAHLNQPAATAQARSLRDGMDVSDWLTRCLRNSIDDAIARLQSGLAVLASVGSTAPFVGLFGTVWGIYHALLSIGAAGQATIDRVAGPIGEALVMTAFGLVVAIPAVLGYNALVRGNKNVVGQLNRFGHDLHAYFVTGSRVQSAPTPKA